MRRLITAALVAGSAMGALAKDDIIQTAAANGNFDTLVGLIVAADLEDALDSGTFTVFAPTDDAFSALPEGTLQELRKPENRETLRDILTYHILDSRLTAPTHPPSHPVTSAKALNGQELRFEREGSTVRVNGNKIIQRNIECSNGIIQVIDGVLLPDQNGGNTIVDIASNDERFTTLVKAVKAAGLVDALSGETELTVLAPTNDAFDDLPRGTLSTLLKEKNRDQLAAVLKDHVIKGSLNARDLAGRDSVETLRGTSLPVAIENGSLTIGGASVVLNDIEASNGIVHVISSVIVTGGRDVSDAGERVDTVRINAGWNNKVNRDGIRADRVIINVSGGGTVGLTNIDANEIITKIAGGGFVAIAGRAGSHEANVSGGARLSALSLVTDSTDVDVAGGGTALVNAADELDIEASAGATVQFADTDARIRKSVNKYASVQRVTEVASGHH